MRTKRNRSMEIRRRTEMQLTRSAPATGTAALSADLGVRA
jgi:hypothetical protein